MMRNGNALTGPNYIPYTYDGENRLISDGTYTYDYDPQNKRVMRQTGNSNILSSEFTFYGIGGQRLSTFTVTSQSGNFGGCSNGAAFCSTGPIGGYVYFAGKMIMEPGGAVATDRLGSVRSGIAYYPWERR
jgi:hypothetical protein